MRKINLKLNIFFIIFIFSIFGCAHHHERIRTPHGFCQVKGAVSYKSIPLSGAVVEIYTESQVDPFITLTVEKADGKFSVNLPLGSYYFVAKKTSEGSNLKEGDFFCYYGGNPVQIFEPEQEIVLKCVKVHNVVEEKSDDLSKIKLTGKVVDIEGRPLENAYVYLFSASNPDLRRLADMISEPTLSDGQFVIDVDTPGNYFLIVRKRKSGQERGPIKLGDYYGYSPANPLEIKTGKKLSFIIECLEKKKDFVTSNNPLIIPSGMSAIWGKIIDKNGSPVSDVFAFAYVDEFNSGKKPDYKSAITEKDGNYTILINKEGSYIVGARKTYGGPPEPGDIFGFYKGTSEYKIELKQGEVNDNLDIVVEEVK